jgi:hypothetical protein
VKKRILLKVLKNYFYIYKSTHVCVNSFGEVIPEMLTPQKYKEVVKRLESGGIKNIKGYKWNKYARQDMNRMRKYVRHDIELQRELSKIRKS